MSDDTVGGLLSEFDQWKVDREAVSVAEEKGAPVSASRWESSDDDAADLLERLAAAVRSEGSFTGN